MATKAIDAKRKHELALNVKKISELIPKARRDEKAAAELWKVLEAAGTVDHFVKDADVAYSAEYSLIKSYNGDDVLGRQMSQPGLDLMCRELGGDNPTPLEKLLCERIALCWFHVHLCELTLAQKHSEMTLTIATYHTKRLDSAHKRYLGAIKALAQVRKLQLPNVQVNIGEKQINIGEVKAG